jgi:hypothetical protein
MNGLFDDPDPRDEIERDLRRLGRETPFPPTPPIAASVRNRLETEARQSRPTRRFRFGWATPRRGRPLVLALVALVALTASAVAATALGLPGLRFNFVQTPPTPNVQNDPSHVRLALGIQTTLADAASRVDFPIIVPSGLGPPDEVYLGSTNQARGRVVLLYRRSAGSTLTGDIGLLVTEFSGQLDAGFDTKWIAEGDTNVQYVDVNGSPGYWFSGAPHVYEYLNEIAGVTGPTRRQVGDVFVWERNGIVYRIESPLGLASTRDIAASMR